MSMCDCNQGRLPCTCKSALSRVIAWREHMACNGEPVPPAGDVEVLSMKYGEQPTEEDGQLVRHVDHLACVNRLTAERDGLLAQLESFGEDVGQLKSEVSELEQERDTLKLQLERKTDVYQVKRAELTEERAKNDALQSELTKARELLHSLQSEFPSFSNRWNQIDMTLPHQYTPHQSEPAAKGGK